jgi:hypothetical protein
MENSCSHEKAPLLLILSILPSPTGKMLETGMCQQARLGLFSGVHRRASGDLWAVNKVLKID